MKLLYVLFIVLIVNSTVAYGGSANCFEGVSAQIITNGYLNESDRTRLMSDCKKYQDFRLGVKKNPKGAYILNRKTFTCGKRKDYVHVYNKILKDGGTYNPIIVNRYKSCRVIRASKLTAVRTQKNPKDSIVEILYHGYYSVYFLHSQWVHKNELVPYAKLINRQVK